MNTFLRQTRINTLSGPKHYYQTQKQHIVYTCGGQQSTYIYSDGQLESLVDLSVMQNFHYYTSYTITHTLVNKVVVLFWPFLKMTMSWGKGDLQTGKLTHYDVIEGSLENRCSAGYL